MRFWWNKFYLISKQSTHSHGRGHDAPDKVYAGFQVTSPDGRFQDLYVSTFGAVDDRYETSLDRVDKYQDRLIYKALLPTTGQLLKLFDKGFYEHINEDLINIAMTQDKDE